MNFLHPTTIIPLLAMLMLITSATAADEPPAPTISLPGTIEAFEAADLFTKDTGFVSQVQADIGDHVTAGQVLATIDDPELARQVDAAKATLTAKQEMAKASDATVMQSEKALVVTQSQLSVYKADLELAEVTLKRQEELFAGKATTEQQIDETRAKAHSATALMQVGQAKVAMAQADITAAQANRGVAQAQVIVAESEMRRLQALLDYTTIKAPFDGVVTKRVVNRGDLVTAGRTMSLMTVQRMDVVRIFCDVPEGSAEGVVVGAVVTIKLYGSTGPSLNARVTRIAGALDPATRTMRVEIDLPNPQEKLRPGTYAQVTLTLRPPPSAAGALSKP